MPGLHLKGDIVGIGEFAIADQRVGAETQRDVVRIGVVPREIIAGCRRSVKAVHRRGRARDDLDPLDRRVIDSMDEFEREQTVGDGGRVAQHEPGAWANQSVLVDVVKGCRNCPFN